MIRTQVYLTAEEHQGVKQLAVSSGKKNSEIIRNAIDEYLQKLTPENKLSRLRKAKGLWKKHQETDLSEIRQEFDRF